MMKYPVAVLALFVSLTVRAQQWQAVSPLNDFRDGHASVTGPDGNVYVFGGGQNSSCFNTVERYDRAANQWTRVASMSVVRCNVSAVTGADGYLYVIGGDIGNTSTSLVERYDTRSGTWQQIASLNVARTAPAVAVGPDLRIYVMGGSSQPASAAVTSIEMFDGNTWSLLPVSTGVPSPRHAVTGADGNIYAFTEAPATWAMFDGVNWVPRGALFPTTTGAYTVVTAPDGLMYLLGAGQGSKLSGSGRVVTYDANGYVGDAPPLLQSRDSAAAAVSDGGIVISGGYRTSGGVLANAEEYRPVAAPLFDGAKAWFRFDDPLLLLATDSIGGPGGTLAGGATYVNGVVDRSIQLDGKKQYVKVPSSPSTNFGNGDLTIEGWIRWSPTGNSVLPIADKRTGPIPTVRGYELFLYRGRLGVQLANGMTYRNYIAASDIPANRWTHVAATVDRANGIGSLYVNGALVLRFAPLNGTTSTAAPLLIGRNSLDATLFRGAIDELTLYGRALTWPEIRALFLAGSAGKQ
jgi:hypothetical protein